jgi:hypothetical protein
MIEKKEVTPMRKSQSESPLLLLSPLKIRGAGGVMNPERGIPKDSPRGREQCLARAKKRNPKSQAPNPKQFQSTNDQNSLEI